MRAYKHPTYDMQAPQNPDIMGHLGAHNWSDYPCHACPDAALNTNHFVCGVVIVWPLGPHTTTPAAGPKGWWELGLLPCKSGHDITLVPEQGVHRCTASILFGGHNCVCLGPASALLYSILCAAQVHTSPLDWP